MAGKHKPEVLVVGAGPVGLLTALSLARRGVAVRVVDAAWRGAAQSYSLALHSASLALLDEVGLAAAALEGSYLVKRLGFYDRAERRVSLALDGLVEGFPAVAVVRQDRLEHLLEKALEAEGVGVDWSHRAAAIEPEGERVRVRIDRLVKESVGYSVAHTEWVVAGSKQLEVPFVIGADGHRSLVRRALEIDFPEVGPVQQFALFEFKSDADLDHELRVVLGERDTDVLWPLPEGYCRWSFELLYSEIPEEVRAKSPLAIQVGTERFPVLEPGRLGQLLEARAPWFSGSIDEIRWRMVVRFERRLAAVFGRGRAWLAGDAAHIHHPVGGQSMNVGLREGHELAAIVTEVVRGGASPDRLEAYGRARRAEWSRLYELAGSPQPQAGADRWLAGRAAGRLQPCLPASGAGLDRLLDRLGFRPGS